ncbi:tc3a_0 protein [Trichonephila clavipes]|nr:tc3a_0 protein [Trichonephila clavipes]
MWTTNNLNEEKCRPVMTKIHLQCQCDRVIYSSTDGKQDTTSERKQNTSGSDMQAYCLQAPITKFVVLQYGYQQRSGSNDRYGEEAVFCEVSDGTCSMKEDRVWMIKVKKFKLALLSKMATELTAVKRFILSLVWQFIMNRLTPEQRFQIVQFYFENNGRDFHKRILFSDEAHFWLNGYVNKQNCRIWSEANPQVYVETPLHPEKLTV